MDLSEAIADWKPEPTQAVDRIAPWPVAAFSGLLDLPDTAAHPGDPLPPLWHWLQFLNHPRQSELSEDGHPTAGDFLPPIPDRRRMFAGGRLQVYAPMRVGDEITRHSEVTDVRVKRGRSGDLAFVTVRHDYRRDSDLLMTEHQDVVYRSQPAGAYRSARTDDGPAAGPQHDWSMEIRTDPALLFRFSALTYNTHRIHFDRPYATTVEGYPGLVVHGPLLALLLLEIPRRNLPHRAVTQFEFRLARPMFCGEMAVAVGSADGDLGLTLSAALPGAADSITGRVRLAPPR